MIYFAGKPELFESTSPDVKYVTPSEISELINKEFEITDFVEFDTETTGLDPHTKRIILYQFGNKDNQYVIDNSIFPITNFKYFIESKTLVGQNLKFDLQFLYKQRIVPTKVYDTFLAESVIYTGYKDVKKSLDAILKRRLGIEMSKEERSDFSKAGFKLQLKHILYAAKDTAYMGLVREQQLEELINLGLTKVCDLENKFVIGLAYIEYCGMPFNREKWSMKVEEDKKLLKEKREILNAEVIKLNHPEFSTYSLFGNVCSIKWSSPDQVQKLFKFLGVNINTKDKKSGEEKESVTAKLIESQRDKHPIVGLYIDYKKIEKLNTSFGENFFGYINSSTGRVHTSYKQILDTGRISCGGKGKKRKDDRPNLQQIPSDKRHRSCFETKGNMRLVIADYSSQESRVLVEFSQESTLVNFYLSDGADLHSYTAKLVYPELSELSLDEVKKFHKDKRQLMKTVNFGLAYGGTAQTISQNANIPMEQAEQVYNDYFKAFPELGKYFEKAREYPVKNGFVLVNNISGRKSFIPFYKEYKELEKIVSVKGFWEKYRNNKAEYIDTVKKYFRLKGNMERRGLNFCIQGTSADMSKLAVIKLFAELRNRELLFKVGIVNAVHDELLMECNSEIADEMSKLLQKCMEEAGSVFCKTIPITAETNIDTWWNK